MPGKLTSVEFVLKLILAAGDSTGWHLEESSSMVAKVRGLPGFILTFPKCTLPCLSSKGLMKSRSPMETPPASIVQIKPASCVMPTQGYMLSHGVKCGQTMVALGSMHDPAHTSELLQKAACVRSLHYWIMQHQPVFYKMFMKHFGDFHLL